MSPRRPSAEHQEAVQRRLARLRVEMPVEGLDGVPTGLGQDVPAASSEDGPMWPSVPVPGRHAARRPGAWTRDLLEASLPDSLRGRVRLGAAQLTVVALVVAVALAVTCWWLVRGQPDELQAPALEPAPGAPASPTAPIGAGGSPAPTVPAMDATPTTGAATAAATGAATGANGAASPVTVDVAGKVRRPGIVVLDPGARVVDALEAAGGARRGVDLTPLNLARLLVDGEQVVVGAPAGAPPPAAPPGPGTASSGAVPGPGALVDLNTATEQQLEALPEIGPVTAQSILTWRDQHGRFSTVDELLEVDGIGDATLAKLTPYVTV